ncbi:Cartilage intermediate layer protein 1, partial [Oryzias melastigma]
CWTQWFDRDDPTATGDWETLSDLRNQFPDKVCPNPVDVEATTLSGTPADQTGEVFFKYDTTSGFVCRNEDQNGGMCKDYRVRFSCPSSYCTEKVCWTEWFDRDNPSGTGDWELLSDLRRENPGQICETPQYIQAKADSVLGVFKRDKFYIYNPTKGFVCRNEDQNSRIAGTTRSGLDAADQPSLRDDEENIKDSLSLSLLFVFLKGLIF